MFTGCRLKVSTAKRLSRREYTAHILLTIVGFRCRSLKNRATHTEVFSKRQNKRETLGFVGKKQNLAFLAIYL